MRLVLALVGAVIAGAAILAYLSAGGAPKAVVVPPSYDFGRVPYTEVVATLRLVNTGDAPLVVEGVSTSCGCTRAEVSKSYLKPGEEAELRISFDPRRMGTEIEGEVYREVYILTNDPEKPELVVPVRAVVVR
ncbi:MAG: DUF1573 domain-containing protein [Euryarchaeota archaeon]|nr:DUF1573 domain-containing protein [Euryarchaeota archaeon]